MRGETPGTLNLCQGRTLQAQLDSPCPQDKVYQQMDDQFGYRDHIDNLQTRTTETRVPCGSAALCFSIKVYAKVSADVYAWSL